MNSQGQLAAASNFPALEANVSAQAFREDCAAVFQKGINDAMAGKYDESSLSTGMGDLPAHQLELYRICYRSGRYSQLNILASSRDAFAGETGRAVAYGFDDALAGRKRDSMYIPSEGTSWNQTDMSVLDNVYSAAYQEGSDLKKKTSGLIIAGVAAALLAGFGGVYWWQKRKESEQPQGAPRLATANPSKSPGMTVQSLLFSRDQWDVKSAKGWAKEHGYRYGDVDEKPNTIRMRQHDPDGFRKRTMRTIEFGDGYGIKAVVGKPNR